jgi:hypothetical protein
MSQLVDEARRVAQTHLEVSRPARWQHVTAVAARALDRDFQIALHWLCTNTLKYRHPQHEKK